MGPVEGSSQAGIIAYHLILRPKADRGIANTARALRDAARLTFEQGERYGLLAFRIVDSHAHVLLACTRAETGRFAQRLGSCLTQTLPVLGGFGPGRVLAINDRRHLANALRYVFRQEEHHGVWLDPAHDGSSLPDLLGLRCVVAPSLARRVLTLLPRLSDDEMVPWLGNTGWQRCLPAPGQLLEASAAALGLPDLGGRSPRQKLARATAVHATAQVAKRLAAHDSSQAALALRALDNERGALAQLLGTSVDTICRARSLAVDPALKEAVIAQWCLRTRIAAEPERRSGHAA